MGGSAYLQLAVVSVCGFIARRRHVYVARLHRVRMQGGANQRTSQHVAVSFGVRILLFPSAFHM